ncbi:hypothetical protein SDC9_117166 [bioreactor metagenome]|uniref:Uncharacterized protein n=1 Tax=bioreactor metagenome TaxID=1076179 RepID=A0A645C4D8_9ZZZZ
MSRDGIADLIVLRNFTVLHHIAMGGKGSAFALTHFLADLIEVQPLINTLRKIFKLWDKVVVCIELSKGNIVCCLVNHLTMFHAVGHIDEPVHRDWCI